MQGLLFYFKKSQYDLSGHYLLSHPSCATKMWAKIICRFRDSKCPTNSPKFGLLHISKPFIYNPCTQLHYVVSNLHLTFNTDIIGNNTRDNIKLILTDCSHCMQNVFHKESGVVCWWLLQGCFYSAFADLSKKPVKINSEIFHKEPQVR